MLFVEQGPVARLGDLTGAQCPFCSQPCLFLALNSLPHNDRDRVEDRKVPDLGPGIRGCHPRDKEPVGAHERRSPQSGTDGTVNPEVQGRVDDWDEQQSGHSRARDVERRQEVQDVAHDLV